MAFRADLKTKLRVASDLAALVAARVHWLQRPRDGLLPAVTIEIFGAGRLYHHGGAMGLARPRVRFKCWGETLEAAVDVADALTPAIEAKGTTGTTAFKGAFLEMETDLAPAELGDGTLVPCAVRDFTVWHQPAS
ncbi:MAG: hypothetical protein QOH47_809 [Sphingomonadales bacterium]|jgi:hypothetical protein|nr:hypothetical protein [Sphingomonadales bacterium]